MSDNHFLRTWYFALAMLAVLTLAVSSASAQEFTFTTLAGETIQGTLESIGDNGELSGPGIDGLTLENVSLITSGRSVGDSLGDHAAEIHVVDGGKILASNIKIVDEVVGFESKSGLNLLSLQNVAGIVWRSGLPIQPSGLISQAFANPPEDNDTVIVESGGSLTAVAGLLEELQNETLRLNYTGKSRPIGAAKIVAIVGADLKLAGPTGALALVTLVDGSTIGGALTAIDRNSIYLEISGGQRVVLPIDRFVSAAIKSDSVLFLSSVDPIEVEQQPVFAASRPWQRNLSVGGNPIKLSGEPGAATKSFNQGIGVQSYSRLVFANADGFDRFRAVAGIDLETKGRGDCEMSVIGDGIELWQQRVQGGHPAVEIDVDITGINQIELLVRPGEQFDLADHADWADARFIKTK